MAEERLLDDDKDRDSKYRISVNADGEEELTVVGGEEAVYEVPDVGDSDDEEAAVLTPEQLAAKREKEEAERRKREEKIEELLNKAKSDCSLYRYATAADFLAEVEELDDKNGELYALKATAYTCGFTDFSQVTTVAKDAEKLKTYTSKERRERLDENGGAAIEENIARLKEEVTALNRENEGKKAERAVKFVADRNKALLAFGIVFIILAAFVACTAVFATRIYSIKENTFYVLTIVFAVFTGITLCALALASRWLNITQRRVKLNKRNTSTKLGREVLVKQSELKASIALLEAIRYEEPVIETPAEEQKKTEAEIIEETAPVETSVEEHVEEVAQGEDGDSVVEANVAAEETAPSNDAEAAEGANNDIS